MKYNLKYVKVDTTAELVDYVKLWLKNECASAETVKNFLDEINTTDEAIIIDVCHKYIDIVNDLSYENGFVDICDCLID